MNPVQILILAVIAAGVGGAVGWFLKGRDVRFDLRALAEFKKNILRRSGCTTLVPGVTDYTIESYDGGKTWYAVRDTTLEIKERPDGSHYREFKLEIVGLADDVYPGLVAHLAGMDDLLKHVRQHGPIIISDSTTLGDVNALAGAGFRLATAVG